MDGGTGTFLPSCENITYGCLGLKGDGCKQLSVKGGIRHVQTVDIETGPFRISSQRDALFLGIGEFQGPVLLQLSHLVAQPTIQIVLDLVGGSVGYTIVILRHRTHGIGQFIHDAGGAIFLKDTAGNDAESIDELLAEFFVLKQVLEELHHVHPVIVFDGGDGTVPGIEGIVEVEAYKTEPSVVPTAVGLHIILGPVVVADI